MRAYPVQEFALSYPSELENPLDFRALSLNPLSLDENRNLPRVLDIRPFSV